MIRASDIMTSLPRLVGPEELVPALVSFMVERSLEAVPVLDAERRLLGVVALRDLVARAATPAHLLDDLSSEDPYRVMSEFRDEHVRLHALTASQIMRTEAPTVAPDAQLSQVADVMANFEFLPVFVVEGERPIGMITPLGLCSALITLTPTPPEPGEQPKP
jgi:CBS domain-containing protein